MNVKSKTVWIMSGESSGDLYGASIAEEIRKKRPDTIIRGMGGKHSKAAGIDLFVDSSELGVVGFIDVLLKLGTFIHIFFDCIKRAEEERPDVVLLIDNPGLNMRLGKQFAKLGIPVVWYISPQVWAWRKSNIPKFAKFCKRMIVIFPFEPDVWAGSGLDVIFAGHPLVDIVEQRHNPGLVRDPNRVLILPGSRKKEVTRLLQPFLLAAIILHKRHPNLKFAVSTPRETINEYVNAILEETRRKYPEINDIELDVSIGDTPVQQQVSIAGMAASGTVTVESALAGLPLAVAYKLDNVTFFLAVLVIRKLFRNVFTMVNIILNRKSFEEFLQWQVTPEHIADAVERILPGGSRREEVEHDMAEMKQLLSTSSEGALAKAADLLLETMDTCARGN